MPGCSIEADRRKRPPRAVEHRRGRRRTLGRVDRAPSRASRARRPRGASRPPAGRRPATRRSASLHHPPDRAVPEHACATTVGQIRSPVTRNATSRVRRSRRSSSTGTPANERAAVDLGPSRISCDATERACRVATTRDTGSMSRRERGDGRSDGREEQECRRAPAYRRLEGYLIETSRRRYSSGTVDSASAVRCLAS